MVANMREEREGRLVSAVQMRQRSAICADQPIRFTTTGLDGMRSPTSGLRLHGAANSLGSRVKEAMISTLPELIFPSIAISVRSRLLGRRFSGHATIDKAIGDSSTEAQA